MSQCRRYRITSLRESGSGSYGTVYIADITDMRAERTVSVALKVAGKLGEELDNYDFVTSVLLDECGSHVNEFFMQRLLSLVCGQCVTLQSYGVWIPDFADEKLLSEEVSPFLASAWRDTGPNPVVAMEVLTTTLHEVRKTLDLKASYDIIASGRRGENNTIMDRVHTAVTGLLYPAIVLRKMERLSRGRTAPRVAGTTFTFPKEFYWMHGDIKETNIGVKEMPSATRTTIRYAPREGESDLFLDSAPGGEEAWSASFHTRTHVALIDLGMATAIRFTRPEELMAGFAIGKQFAFKCLWTPRARKSEPENSRMMMYWNANSEFPDDADPSGSEEEEEEDEEVSASRIDEFNLLVEPARIATPAVRERAALMFGRQMREEGPELDRRRRWVREESYRSSDPEEGDADPTARSLAIVLHEYYLLLQTHSMREYDGLMVTEWYRAVEVLFGDFITKYALPEAIEKLYGTTEDTARDPSEHGDARGPCFGMDPTALNMSEAYIRSYDRFFAAEGPTVDMYALGVSAFRVLTPNALGEYFSRGMGMKFAQLMFGPEARVAESKAWYCCEMSSRIALYIALRFYQARMAAWASPAADAAQRYETLSTETLQAACIMEELVMYRRGINNPPKVTHKAWDMITDRKELIHHLDESNLDYLVHQTEEAIAYEMYHTYARMRSPSIRYASLALWDTEIRRKPSREDDENRAFQRKWMDSLLQTNTISMLHFAPVLRGKMGSYDKTVRMMAAYLEDLSKHVAWGTNTTGSGGDTIRVDLGDMLPRVQNKSSQVLFSMGPGHPDGVADPMPEFIFRAVSQAEDAAQERHRTRGRKRSIAPPKRRHQCTPESIPDLPPTRRIGRGTPLVVAIDGVNADDIMAGDEDGDDLHCKEPFPPRFDAMGRVIRSRRRKKSRVVSTTQRRDTIIPTDFPTIVPPENR